jgi:biopolymer transport protein ExbB
MILQITETPSTDLSIASLLIKGGIVMIPIALLSVAALYVLVERYRYIRAATKGRRDLMLHIKKYLQSGDIKAAKVFAEQDSSAMGKILLSGLDHIGKPVKEIETMMESATNIEIAEMEKNTEYLGIIAGIAPMLGFVGTILGIIRIFYDISLSDNISIGIIAGGLYQKMITSGSGLVVGILAYAAYHYLQQKINRFSLRVQRDVFEFMRSILSPAS